MNEYEWRGVRVCLQTKMSNKNKTFGALSTHNNALYITLPICKARNVCVGRDPFQLKGHIVIILPNRYVFYTHFRHLFNEIQFKI